MPDTKSKAAQLKTNTTKKTWSADFFNIIEGVLLIGK